MQTNKKLPTLLVINDSFIGSGGAEIRIRSLVNNLADSGKLMRVVTLSSDKPDNHLFSDSVFHYSFTSGCNYKSAITLLEDILTNNNCNIIQIHNLSNSDVLKAVINLKRRFQFKIIFFAHDLYPICGKRSLINPLSIEDELCKKTDMIKCLRCMGPRTYLKLRLNKLLFNKIDAGIAPSNAFIKIFEQNNLLNGKWKLVRPWIDPAIFKFRPSRQNINKKINILFVGSLTPYKGAFILARSIKFLKYSINDFSVIFLGSEDKNSNRRYVESILKKDKTERYVRFIGRQPKKELYNIMSSASLLVFPSICIESFGQVWAEAAFFGVPVLASDIPSIREYSPFINFFKTGDSADLARKALNIIKEQEKLKAMHEKGNSGARTLSSKRASLFIKENFEISKSLREIIQIYNHI